MTIFAKKMNQFTINYAKPILSAILTYDIL